MMYDYKNINSGKPRVGIIINCQSYRDDERHFMSPTNDLEDELLRRFQALKSTPTTNPIAAPFKGISDDQARKAKEEDDELERIADGRPPPFIAKENGVMDDELARRMAKLKGVEFEVEIDDVDDDQEVRGIVKWTDGIGQRFHRFPTRYHSSYASSIKPLEGG